MSDTSPELLSVEQVLVTSCNTLAMASAVYLTVVCLRPSRRKRLLAQQIAALSFTDVLLGIFRLVVPAVQYGCFWYSGDPPWCGPFMWFQRWLQVQSMLVSATIPLGVLAALLRFREAHQKFRQILLVMVPVSVLLNMGYWLLPARFVGDAPLPYCSSQVPAERTFVIELIVFFVFVSAVLWLANCRLRTTSPGSVARRSLRGSRRYMLAFLCSWAIYVFSVLREWTFGKDVHSLDFWIFHTVREAFVSLNAFLNFIAFVAERREALRAQRPRNAVAFNSRVSGHTISVAASTDRTGLDRREEEEDDEDDEDWFWLGYSGDQRTPEADDNSPRDDGFSSAQLTATGGLSSMMLPAHPSSFPNRPPSFPNRPLSFPSRPSSFPNQTPKQG